MKFAILYLLPKFITYMTSSMTYCENKTKIVGIFDITLLINGCTENFIQLSHLC